MDELEFHIGKTTVPYRIVESPKAKKKRLVLTPFNMEVRVPIGSSQLDVVQFLDSKVEWIIQSWDELKSKVALDVFPQCFAPGSKVMKWGRFVRLEFLHTSTDCLVINGNSPIRIELPKAMNWQLNEGQIADAVTTFLISRLKDAIDKLVDLYSEKIAIPKGWAISKSSDKWGYCTPDGNIGFHWQLVCCPKSVLEYVVVHELSHLLERSHSEKFWSLVKSVLPQYELQKKWLEIEGARIAANREL
ncbi:MAG: M48 family peptidase [Proteobacteria bacterium]|nr:MAG: M48 family peptidase [Pseudomonadota bacterium]